MNETINKTADINEMSNRQRVLHAVQQWKAVLDESPDMVAILDSETKIIMLNRTACLKLGISGELAAGKNYCTLLHNGNASHPACPREKLKISGEPHISTEPINILGGFYKVSVSPLKDETGQMIATVHVAQELR